MFLAAFLILIGMTGLVITGLLLLVRVSEHLSDMDANTGR